MAVTDTAPSTPTAARPSRLSRGRVTIYGSLRLIVEALVSARGLVLAQLLGAGAFGTWALFRLLLSYAHLGGLGYQHGLEKRIASAPPGSPDRLADAQTGNAFALLTFGAISLFALVAAWLVPEPGARAALLGVAVCLLVERLWSYGIIYLRATASFRDFALIELGSATINLVLVLALAMVLGLPGAVLGFLLAYALGLLAMLRRVPYRPALDLGRLRALLHIGLPLSLSHLLGTMMSSIDRLVLLAFTDITTLGLYAFAVAVGNLGGAAGGVLRTLVFPRLYRHAAEEGARTGTVEHMRRTLLPFAWLTTPIIALAAAGVPLATAWLAPGFTTASTAAAIFLVGGVAVGSAQLVSLGVIAAGRQWLTPWVTGAGLGANLLAAVLVLQSGLGLTALALTTVAVRIAHLTALVFILDMDRRQRIRTAAALATPIIWCAALVFAVAVSGMTVDLRGLGLALAATALGLLPLAVPAWRILRNAAVRTHS